MERNGDMLTATKDIAGERFELDIENYRCLAIGAIGVVRVYHESTLGKSDKLPEITLSPMEISLLTGSYKPGDLARELGEMVHEFAVATLAEAEKQKPPFWAKKWKGQRS